ncbi:hypothetical protein NHX12_029761 [Muraenolepis orangiensis]|uniref:Uncharacterized protein n=1 Tax=Muraenolepis orangiensis TaxID=630683 RepID=A0A9Q0EAT0_9TELE|nr:hypothetical protein NHX12_029761 [Muraenolepis orangiensis]
MDGKLTPTDMNDGTADLLTEDLPSSETPGDSAVCPTGPSLPEGSRDSQLHVDPKDEVIRALPVYATWCGENHPPLHPPARLPLIRDKPTTNEKTQLYSSASGRRLKTTSYTDQTLNDDLCAPILLACLFCNPLDCLWASVTGCHACTLSLCSYLCGCQPTLLVSLLHTGDWACCSWDCNVCCIRFPATECLDLAMEFSQMVFH